VFRPTLDDCELLRACNSESETVLPFVIAFVFICLVITNLSGIDTLDYRPTQRSKLKRGLIQQPDGARTSYESPNKFAVVPERYSDIEDYAVPSQPSNRKSSIPPIAIYLYLNNHSATLKKVNEKVSIPVDVKSKSQYLLLCTKSLRDYKVLSTEVQLAKLVYHTHSQALSSSDVLKIKKYIIASYRRKNTRTPSPSASFNCQYFGHSFNLCGKPQTPQVHQMRPTA
jgi:hypothetical protein